MRPAGRAKERAGQVRPALVVWLRMHSEDNLQRQLGVVRLAGADAGRAVRDADGLSARPEQGTVTANAGTSRVSRRRQVGMVEKVKHLHAELPVHTLLVDGE